MRIEESFTETERITSHMVLSRHEPAASMLEMAAALTELAGSLANTVKDAEPPFIRLGGDLQAVFGDAAGLTQQTLEIIKLIGADSDGGILSRLDALVNSSLTALNSCHSGAEADLIRIKTVAVHLEKLYRVCETAENISRYLRMIGVNILIRSSEAQEFTELFSFIGRECEESSLQIIETADKVREDARRTRFAQEAFHGRIGNRLAELRRLTADAQQVVQKAFDEIERLIHFTSRILVQANGQTSEISKQVGGIVVGIQLYDSMNQRIEHIAKAINDAGELCEQGPGNNASGNAGTDQAGPVYSCLGVQIGQLQQVISEINAMHQQSLAAFTAIGTVIGQLTDSLATLGPADDGPCPLDLVKENDPFTALSLSLTHLQTLLARGDGLVEQIRETTSQAAEKVTRFSDHLGKIRRISWDMHMIAINAIVKALHLGQKGSAFSVLAKELSDLSRRANIFVRNAKEVIETIIDSRQDGPGPIPDRDRLPAMDLASLESAVSEVASTYGVFRDNSAMVSARAGDLKRTLATISTELDFLPALAKSLNTHLERLTAIHQHIGSCLDPETLASASTAVVDSLTARYTMQRERDIHARWVPDAVAVNARQPGPSSVDPDKVPAPACAATGENDLGDNVELF